MFPLVWYSIPVRHNGLKVGVFGRAEYLHKRRFWRAFASEQHQVSIKLNKAHELLRVYKMNEDKAEIDALDLRPLGFDIHRDKGGLHVGRTVLAQNLFVGGTIIRLPPEQTVGVAGGS
ncbi:MAG: hypothetical protein ACREJ0_06680 [Geminicoccaceae bacterium]